MKKIQQEELVSKSIIFTAIILVIMICTRLTERVCNEMIPPPAIRTYMPHILIGFSIAFLILAIVFVVLGFRKNQKYFEISTWTAGLATFSMLLNIHYFVKGLEVKLPGNFFVLPNVTIKLYAVAMALFTLTIVFIWIKTIVKLIKG